MQKILKANNRFKTLIQEGHSKEMALRQLDSEMFEKNVIQHLNKAYPIAKDYSSFRKRYWCMLVCYVLIVSSLIVKDYYDLSYWGMSIDGRFFFPHIASGLVTLFALWMFRYDAILFFNAAEADLIIRLLNYTDEMSEKWISAMLCVIGAVAIYWIYGKLKKFIKLVPVI